MNDNQYISVSEFAKKANVSRQTIYNRLDTDLTGFVKEDLQTGRKTIDIKALNLFNNGQSRVKDDVKSNVKIDKDFDKLEFKTNNEKLDLLIESLQKQLEEKEKNINELKSEKQELKEELRQANEHNRSLSIELVELNRNQQILLGRSQDKVIELESPEVSKESLFKKIFKKS